MKHIIITGGAGFIGSHLCERFLSEGYAVTAIDNLCTGRESNLEAFKASLAFQFVRHNVCEPFPEGEIKLLAQYGLEGVLHFACPASPVDFDRIPFEILAVDSVGTMRSVELALRHGARYLLASTSECYGDPLIHPQREDYWGNVNPVGPRSCYDEAKRFAEAYVSTAANRGMEFEGKSGKHKLNAGIVRIFNTYGPRMRPDDGRLVPELCLQALNGQALTLHGDGRQTRSFCFVSDLVEGVYRLFRSKHLGPVNIGNPEEYSVIDFAEILKRLMKSAVPTRYLPPRPDDPRKRCPDITLAQKYLDWSPVISLEEGLKRTLEDFKRGIADSVDKA